MGKEAKRLDELSSDFSRFLEEEGLKSRAYLMVDAMLEENPSLDPEKAFRDALESLTNRPEDFPEQITSDGNDNHE